MADEEKIEEKAGEIADSEAAVSDEIVSAAPFLIIRFLTM